MQSNSRTLLLGIIPKGGHEVVLRINLHIDNSYLTATQQMASSCDISNRVPLNIKKWTDDNIEKIQNVLVKEIAERFEEISRKYTSLDELKEPNVCPIIPQFSEDASEQDLGLFVYSVNRVFVPLRTLAPVPGGSRLAAVRSASFALDIWTYPKCLKNEVLATISMMG